MLSERKHGLSTKQFLVSAYVRSSRNLKDLKGGSTLSLMWRGGHIRIPTGRKPITLRAYVGTCHLKDTIRHQYRVPHSYRTGPLLRTAIGP